MSNSYRFIRNHINTAMTNISQNLTNKKFSLKTSIPSPIQFSMGIHCLLTWSHVNNRTNQEYQKLTDKHN